MAGELPSDWKEKSAAFVAKVNEKAETIASRKASQNALNGFGPLLPEILGGSADLAGSNLTLWSGCKDVNAPGHDGNYVYYGVREFGMSAIMNGVAVHGGFRPYGATFLMFSEYARNALRMSALMKIPVIQVYTHDSIGLGEDGPTHQPIEQTATLRMIPNMQVWRPCDAVESAVCWQAAIERQDGPSTLVFSRQNLPHVERTPAQIEAIRRGGYVLRDCAGTPDAIIIATGSEVELAMKAAEELNGKGKKIRVVSMPSTNVFDAQDAAYRESVLPSAVTKRVVVEAGVSDAWYKYVGLNGKIVGMDRFGESAPAGVLFKEFGFTVDNVVKTVSEIL
ncbi:transketolase-like TK C-terminal-containing protein [Methylogaea oryzae]